MTTRRKWDPETIHATLEPIVAELGRFPKREELSERGLGGLSTAMGKHGGVAEWRARFADAAPAAAPAAPTAVEVEVVETHVTEDGITATIKVTHEDIATRAYFLALEQGGDPVHHWLTAERELTTA
ncbi:DUF2934 domain-containing protein [Solirubrobacter sp. CPCC 204708]|uniref:DUF2934 domain-containing protein n=1 Tax=Solirubrobacter deserti TaxID=2282478 RepID=A0ABT4RII7_9ACTN|nr:DUF2934 domain-containing protein [Solirubrobacter deserti]MBE2320281.1 DUF2934 domain-containing protein [Solirubrobacter deserti]MDA0138333.1 DUF2934 domain-containing protein [Solirubrobacter deserti]